MRSIIVTLTLPLLATGLEIVNHSEREVGVRSGEVPCAIAARGLCAVDAVFEVQ